jgi:predicted RNA-binding protein with PUA-like domain
MAKATPQIFKSTGFWLLKSEPDCYSIEDFKNDRQTLWTGVRNYQARNFMMHSMKKGDQFLFYHSNADITGVVGVGEILQPNIADPSALDPKSDHHDPKASHDHPIWFCAEVGYVANLKKPVALSKMRAEKPLAKMALLAPGQRLSVQPVTKAEFEWIVKLGSH